LFQVSNEKTHFLYLYKRKKLGEGLIQEML